MHKFTSDQISFLLLESMNCSPLLELSEGVFASVIRSVDLEICPRTFEELHH